jgi:hypothetical protein
MDGFKHFDMENCSTRKTPIDYNHKLSKAQCPQIQDDIEFMKDKPYLSLISALKYLADGTRFDIAYAVGILARFSANPGPVHWAAAQLYSGICRVQSTLHLYTGRELKEN